MTPPVKVGQDVELAIESLAFGGAGVAHVDGFAVFVPLGLPGQTVRARIVKRKSKYAEARVLEVLTRSPDEVTPPCPHFGPCGGCSWQHLSYEKQLEAKAYQVRDCLVRLGGIPDPPIRKILGASDPFHYRNKMEFSFADSVWSDAQPPEPRDPFGGLGLHARGRYDKVILHTECRLMNDWAVRVVTAAKQAAEKTGFPAYSPRRNKGFFRYLVLREGTNTGEKMANLITYPTAAGGDDERAAEAVLTAIRTAQPDMTSLIHGVTGSLASVAFCESFRTVFGPPVIHERLLDDTFEIAPNTFFQTNTRQAERLFTVALDLAGVDREPVDVAYDLYCGVGAFTLPLSRHVGQVYGAEVIESAVLAARANAVRNGRTNAAFVAADMKHALTPEGLVDPTGHLVAPRPGLVILDPPRDGMHPDVSKALVALAPPRVVYISCNPSTLARDAKVLVEGGYTLEDVVPVDMFPQTGHVEVVARFDRKRGA